MDLSTPLKYIELNKVFGYQENSLLGDYQCINCNKNQKLKFEEEDLYDCHDGYNWEYAGKKDYVTCEICRNPNNIVFIPSLFEKNHPKLAELVYYSPTIGLVSFFAAPIIHEMYKNIRNFLNN